MEDLHNGEYEVHGRTLKLEILDTSGSYQFPAMRKLSIRTADGFVLVYSIDDEESFEQVSAVCTLSFSPFPAVFTTVWSTLPELLWFSIEFR